MNLKIKYIVLIILWVVFQFVCIARVEFLVKELESDNAYTLKVNQFLRSCWNAETKSIVQTHYCIDLNEKTGWGDL